MFFDNMPIEMKLSVFNFMKDEELNRIGEVCLEWEAIQKTIYAGYLNKVLPMIKPEIRRDWLDLIDNYKKGIIPEIISVEYQTKAEDVGIIYALVHRVMNRIAPEYIESDTADTCITNSAIKDDTSYITINQGSKQKFLEGLLLIEPFLLACNNENISTQQFGM